MATIYTTLNGSLDPLRARVFADGLEVIVGSKLRPCTTYQWQHDDRTGGGFVDVANAISETYTVPTSTVNNSGDYRCNVTIGSPNDNIEGCPIELTTDTFTVSIVECVGTSASDLTSSGGTGSVMVRHPHYESPSVSFDATWITGSGNTTSTAGATTTTTINYSVGTTLMARQGYINAEIGEIVCSWTLLQDYPIAPTYVATPPTSPEAVPVIGPNVRFEQNSSPVRLAEASFLPGFPPVAYGTVAAVAFHNPGQGLSPITESTPDRANARFQFQWTIDGVNIEDIPAVPPRTDNTTPAGLNAEVRLDDVYFELNAAQDMFTAHQQTLSIADGVVGTLVIGVTVTDTQTGETAARTTNFVINTMPAPPPVPNGVLTGDPGGIVQCSGLLGNPGRHRNVGNFTVTQGTINWNATFNPENVFFPGTSTATTTATGRYALTGVVDENGVPVDISGTLDTANPSTTGRHRDSNGNDYLSRLPVGDYTATIELLTCGTGTGVNRDPGNLSVFAFGNIGTFNLFG